MKKDFKHVYSLYDSSAKNLINSNSKDILEAVSQDELKNMVCSVLCGGNIRDVTEFITRNRILYSNAALLSLIFNESLHFNDINSFLSNMSNMYCNSSNKTERALPLWFLGLTDKGFTNIVGKKDNLSNYTTKLENTLLESSSNFESVFGTLSGEIFLGDKKIPISWDLLNILFTGLGCQTLTLRGSSKSMNGKLFEKLVLGSALSMLGFEYCQEVPDKIDPSKKLFWLSSMDDNEREIDATIVFDSKAISIDIGFIGSGNPEISLDKVTRFRNYKEVGSLKHVLSTIIIIDSIGKNSDLINKASEVNGVVLEMSNDLWMNQLANSINSKLGLQGLNIDICNSSGQQLHSLLYDKIKSIDLYQFIK